MKPNKLKRNLIIIFSIILILTAIIFVLYITTDIFRTKRDAFFRYFSQIPEVLDVLETSEEYETYQKTKETKPYTTVGEVKITDSSNIADQSILDKVKVTVNGKTDNKNEKSNIDVEIKSENNSLFNMQVARDKNLYGFFAPQIADGYIVVRNENIDELAQNIGLENANQFPEEITEIKLDKILEISNTEKKHIEQYVKMIRNDVPDTAYSKTKNEKIEIEGQKYDTTAYTLKLNARENSNLQIQILEKITVDSITMDFITSKCKLLNITDEYTDINMLNKKMKERIELLKNNPDEAGEFSITVYENKLKNIQTKIEYNGKTITISNLQEGNEKNVILKVSDGTKVTTIKIKGNEQEHSLKYQTQENEIIKSIEAKYWITGTVQENNIENHLIINRINDIKKISFEYNDKINFTSDIGTFKDMQDDKVAVVNDYDSNYIKEFTDIIKKQINDVYINQAASIGINLDPIFMN